MSIKIGNNDVKIYIGNKELKRKYLGNQLIYLSRITTEAEAKEALEKFLGYKPTDYFETIEEYHFFKISIRPVKPVEYYVYKASNNVYDWPNMEIIPCTTSAMAIDIVKFYNKGYSDYSLTKEDEWYYYVDVDHANGGSYSVRKEDSRMKMY